MKAFVDVRLDRSVVERIVKCLAEHPAGDAVTVGCEVDLAEIKFNDSYTQLVSDTEICSTTAFLRCK